MDTQAIIGEVQQVLSKQNFPAQKDEVVSQAQQQGASPQTTQALQQLPQQQYSGIEEVLSKLPMDQIAGMLGKFL